MIITKIFPVDIVIYPENAPIVKEQILTEPDLWNITLLLSKKNIYYTLSYREELLDANI